MTDVYDFDENDPSRGDWARDFGKDSDSQQLAAGPEDAANTTPQPYAKVFVHANTPAGIGTHASVLIDDGVDPVHFDPAGSYKEGAGRGSDDTIKAPSVDVDGYLKYHTPHDGPINVYEFPLSKDEAAAIKGKIEDYGTGTKGFCAANTADVLGGVGPFKNLPTPFFQTPAQLDAAMKRLQTGQSSR
jgi:hypothetical protein